MSKRLLDKKEYKFIKEIFNKLKEFHITDPINIIVGCSGGADSISLLLALYYINKLFKKNYNICAMYVDHGLREECKEEAEFVREFCQMLGIEFNTVKLNICKLGNLMMNARTERYKSLCEYALNIEKKTNNCSIIALAHNNDDQVETILMRTLGLCSNNNITGMVDLRYHYWVNKDGKRNVNTIMRPLLHISREDIEYFVRDIKVVKDPTNDNTHYTRNLLRHKIIPYLEKYNPTLKKFLPDLMQRVKEYK